MSSRASDERPNEKAPFREPFNAIMGVLDELGAWGEQRTIVVRAIHRLVEIAGRVAQQDEHRAFTPEDEGSIPSPSTGPSSDELDAHRWRAVRPLLLGADFRWGEPPEPVVCFVLPAGVRIGVSADDYADACIIANCPPVSPAVVTEDDTSR